MKFSTQLSVAALATLASSSAVHENKRADSPITIALESVGNSAVKAVLTNTGAEGINLLKTGTLLDEKPTEKLQVFNAKGKVAFKGMKLRVATTNLQESNFVYLGAGESKELNFDAAALHDLTEGGDFDVVSVGALPFAAANSTELTGSAHPFFSNKLSIKVDGALAAKVPSAISNVKRSKVQSDCTGSKLTATKNALSNCAKLASAAATAAAKGDAKFLEYFKSASNKNTVVARLKAVASECSSSTSGATTSHCTDTENGCESGVLAYTIPSEDYVVNCPLYFSDLPGLTSSCHAQDQATTTLHEFTHAPGVYSPGTDDLGYGYSAASQLSANSALNNADQYALYANAIYSGC